ADGVEDVSGGFMIDALGIDEPRWIMDVDGLPTDAVLAAAQALQTGACNYALVVGTAFSGAGARQQARDRVYGMGSDQYTLPYGLGAAGGTHAMQLQRYMFDYGATREELFSVS